MKKYTLLIIFAFISLFHLHYYNWLIIQWHNSLGIVYPLLVLLSAVSFFYHISQNVKDANPVYTENNKEGTLLLLLGVTAWALSSLGNKYIWLAGISLPLMIHGTLSLSIGKRNARIYIFSIYMLLLLNPLNQLLKPYINSYLKEIAINGAKFILTLIGVNTFKDGFVLHTEMYSLRIIDACSGLESLTFVLLFGAIIAYITQKKLISKIVLFLSIILITIFANILRIAGIVYIGTIFNPDLAAKFFHGTGSIIISLFIYPFIFIEGVLLRKI